MAEQDAAEETVRAGLSESEMRDNVIRLAFGGDPGATRSSARRSAARCRRTRRRCCGAAP